MVLVGFVLQRRSGQGECCRCSRHRGGASPCRTRSYANGETGWTNQRGAPIRRGRGLQCGVQREARTHPGWRSRWGRRDKRELVVLVRHKKPIGKQAVQVRIEVQRLSQAPESGRRDYIMHMY